MPRLSAAAAAISMVFMVSLLIFRSRSERVGVLLHRTICDGEEMGSVPARDNRPFTQMIYAQIVAIPVTTVIGPACRRPQPVSSLAPASESYVEVRCSQG